MRTDSLAQRLIDLVGNATYAKRAAAIGEEISKEDGTGSAVRILEEIESP